MIVLNDYEKGWIEALIDGEGSIFILLTTTEYLKYSIRMSISNTNLELIQKAQQILQTRGQVIVRDRDPRRKISYKLIIAANACRRILPVLDGLIVKREQRKLALEFLELHKRGAWSDKEHAIERERRMYDICSQMQKLNKRGRD